MSRRNLTAIKFGKVVVTGTVTLVRTFFSCGGAEVSRDWRCCICRRSASNSQIQVLAGRQHDKCSLRISREAATACSQGPQFVGRVCRQMARKFRRVFVAELREPTGRLEYPTASDRTTYVVPRQRSCHRRTTSTGKWGARRQWVRGKQWPASRAHIPRLIVR